MAKGYAEEIRLEWEEFEQELLIDAYLKLGCNDPEEDLDLFEDVTFKEDTDIEVKEERKYEIALYPIERYFRL